MRILLTQRKLDDFAGTEMVVLDLARSFKKQGHEVAVYCPRPGRINGLLAANSVPTYDQLKDIPWRPDIIHGHHHLPTIAALAAFDEVPAVYVCHGVRPWVERPPLHPQIQGYVTVSQKMAAHLATTYQIPEDHIHVIPNFVDTNRFSEVRKSLADHPRKAVLFGQSGFRQEEIELLEDVCAHHSIALEKVGPAYGNPRPNPELFLPEFDLAFAIGRSAVEAMACGCAVIPIVPHLAGQLVTSRNFREWTEKNFSPRYFLSADRISVDWLADQLANYDPADVAEVTEKVRREFALEQAVDQFTTLYSDASQQVPTSDTHGALVAHLEQIAREADENWEALQSANAERNRQAALIKEQAGAVREAQRQVRYLLNCVLSKAGGELIDAQNDEWIESIEASGLFDKEWYLETNPDVAAAGMDPLFHYLSYGAAEKREPSPSFDSKSYFLANPHLRGLGISPLEHMVRQMLAASPAGRAAANPPQRPGT